MGDISLLVFSFHVKTWCKRRCCSVQANLCCRSCRSSACFLYGSSSLRATQVLSAWISFISFFFSNLPNYILSVTHKNPRFCVCVFVFVFFRPNNVFPSFRLLSSPLPDDHTNILIKGQAGREREGGVGGLRVDSLPGILKSPSCDHILVVPLLPLDLCTWQDGRPATKRRLIFLCRKNI